MTNKEIVRSNILVKLQNNNSLNLSKIQIDMIDSIIVGELQKLVCSDDIKDQLPSVCDNSNENIVNLFMCTKGRKISQRTAKQYVLSLQRLLEFCNHKPLLKIDSFDVEGYLNSIRNQNNNISLNNQKRNLSAFFTWMRKQHIIVDNPCENVDSYKEVNKPIDHLTAEEFETLKNGCRNLRDRCTIEFLRSTAVRVGEMERIRINNVDWKKGTVSIFGEKTQEYRLVCLDSIALKYLQEYIQERGLSYNSNAPLFTTLKGDKNKCLKRETIRDIVRKISKNANMERKVYPHLFRKTTATNIVKRGGSVHDAGEYLGHKDNTVTGKHYTYLGDEHTIEIFKKYVATI